MSGNGCLEYFHCVKYHIPTRKLRVVTCNNIELEKLRRQQNLKNLHDSHAETSIIQFLELELARQGKIREAGLLRASDDFSALTSLLLCMPVTLC